MRHREFDPSKRAFQLGLKAFHTAFASRERVREDLEKNTNTHIRILHELMKEAASYILPDHQRRSFLDLAEFTLWIYAHDGAYKDCGDWLLVELLNRAPEILPRLHKKNPAEWRINNIAEARGKGVPGERKPLPDDTFPD